jgi:hypothetical protein
MRAKKETQKSAKSARVTGNAVAGFMDEERAAMKTRVEELKAEARRGPRAKKADGEGDVIAKIAEMPESDRAIAERLHAMIKASAAARSPKTWYGMPAYAKEGNIVCSFKVLTSPRRDMQRSASAGQSESRRTNHVAGGVCVEGVDCRRRGKDRRTCEESSELRSLHSMHRASYRSTPRRVTR